MIVLNNIDKLPSGCEECPYVYWPFEPGGTEVEGDCYCGVSRDTLVVGWNDWIQKTRPTSCPLVELKDPCSISASLFDKEEVFKNCTVQVLSNSVTGEISVGWWPGDNMPTGR